jgi:hypothetical protein
MPIDTSTREMPGPGIYRGVPFAHYLGWKAVSASRLKVLVTETPAQLQHEMSQPPDGTEAQSFGTVLHTLVLQPELFPELYQIRPPGRANSNEYKRAEARIMADHPHVTLIKPEDWDRAHRCRDALAKHELAGPALSGGDKELSIVWEEPEYGVTCKARLDAPLAGVGIWDLKSTQDPRPHAWGRDAWKYRYDIQGAFYLRGALSVGLDLPSDFAFIAVKSTAAFGIRIYDFQGDAAKVLNAAWTEVESLLTLWARCRDTGVWPDYPAHVEPFPLPSYAMRQIEDEIFAMEAA